MGCRQLLAAHCVRVHTASPFAQVQLEQGPSGCQLDPSSYSTPSSSHAAMRKEGFHTGHSLVCCTCTVNVYESEVTFADWTTKMWLPNRIGAAERRALFFVANYISTLNQRSNKRNVKDINGHKKCYDLEKKNA